MVDTLFVISGSTASGKSELALRLAAATGGAIVNADSQQLFHDLPILTASPTATERAAIEHRLYGVLSPGEQPSVGRWLGLVAPVLAELDTQGRPAIVTGGTGLYLEALLHGLPELPAVPAEIRGRLAEWAQGRPAPAIQQRLAELDPVMAARLQPTDLQRLLRALEVVLATGRSLASFQTGPVQKLDLPARIVGLALVPPPAIVAERVQCRLEAMLAQGVLDEVADLRAGQPELASLPIAKVHGLRSLLAVVEGRLDLEAAVAAIAAETRQYAKRQRTWFRHRLGELVTLPVCDQDVAVETVLALANSAA